MKRAIAGLAAAAALPVAIPVAVVIAVLPGAAQQAACTTPSTVGTGQPVAGTVTTQVVAQAAYDAGFRGPDLITSIAVAHAESDDVPSVVNSIGASGLWQILRSAHPEFDQQWADGSWANPEVNAQMAYRVWLAAGRSWNPWQTFTEGSYSRWVPEATLVVIGMHLGDGVPFKTTTPPPTTTCTPTSPVAFTGTGAGAAAVRVALSQLGMPYSYGGGGPNGPSAGPGTFVVGWDCSSFAQFAWWQAAHIALPRTSEEQQAWAIPTTSPQPGDLVFFDTPATHVGIYLGNGQMVDEPHTGAVARVEAVWPNVSGYGKVHT